jgi:hypothetical protein
MLAIESSFLSGGGMACNYVRLNIDVGEMSDEEVERIKEHFFADKCFCSLSVGERVFNICCWQIQEARSILAVNEIVMKCSSRKSMERIEPSLSDLLCKKLSPYGSEWKVKAVECPEFENVGHVHDWRNYIPEELQAVWKALSFEARFIAIVMADNSASCED